MVDEYEELARRKVPHVFTGKPLVLGGSEGRDEATARGATYVLDALVEARDLDPESMTVAIQGFGNGGLKVAQMLDEKGYRIVAVSDSKGGIHHDDGLDIEGVVEAKQDEGEVGAYSGDHDTISNEELLALDVDLLIPAALDGVIDEENAEEVSAKIIMEIANGPIASSADEILADAEITILPDILANAGGVVVSYYEWIQGRSGEQWTLERVRTQLEERMRERAEAVFAFAEENEVTHRTAAYALALQNLEF